MTIIITTHKNTINISNGLIHGQKILTSYNKKKYAPTTKALTTSHIISQKFILISAIFNKF
ncbi:MAG: hypothetical protein PHY72_03570 [Candidatus Pacebacteria bacterium]|nr:hypothetical protein [Candidatus Paceibacterota bacterium]